MGFTLHTRRARVVLLLACAALTGVSGCVHRFWTTQAKTIPLAVGGEPAPRQVTSPLKAHLSDGSTVVFRRGALIDRGYITGKGEAYPLLDDAHFVARDSVPLSSVVGLETFEGKLLMAQTVTASIAASAAGTLGTAYLLKAIFGSCPTVYADTGAGPVLQAEGFSYAIAPLLEQRDLDPLAVRPDSDGRIRLELRNEALETHFINQIELVAVTHAVGTTPLPDQSGRLVLVGAERPLTSARDRAGRDLRSVLMTADGQLFSTAPNTVNAASARDVNDWIDLEADGLAEGDSVAVVLRLRNSLLNTVLLYDGILGGRDAPDWLTTGLQGIGTAIDLSRWYARTMGMHATVEGVPLSPVEDARIAGHARLGDVGPIAFRDVAIVLPRAAHDARHVRVRLRFVADDWRIDRAAIAGTFHRPAPVAVALTRVVVPTPARGGPALADTAALRALADADDRYLQTIPGQRMTLEFTARSARTSVADSTTSYLLAWQGWYREWIRGSWLEKPTRATPWVPGDSAVADALVRWRTKRDAFEREFYSSRIAVR